MKNPPLVAVILLNWRNSADTLACLAQLQRSSYPQLLVVVVDNGSADGSAERIRMAYPSLPLICSPVNRGFAGGVNQGIQYAAAHGASYVLLLNSDVSFDPDMLTRLIAAAERAPRAGILSPKIYCSRSQRTLLMYGFRITRAGPRVVGWHMHDRGQLDGAPIDGVPGTAMLIRSSAVRQIGLLDQRFFFYSEDIDYCLRARAAGLDVAVVPEAEIEHTAGGSTHGMSARRQYLLAGTRMLLLRKHRRRFNLPLLILGEAREVINQLRAAAQQRDPAAAGGYLAGLARGLSLGAGEELQ